MSDNKKNDSTSKKVKKSFGSMFKGLFTKGPSGANALEEEAMQTPMKTILKNFFRNKLAIVGLIGFVAIFSFSFIGSEIRPMVATHTELTNSNLPPSTNFLDFPAQLANEKVVEIVSGISFSAAITEDGGLYMWGTELNQEQANVSTFIFDIPPEVRSSKIVDIAAGGSHLLAIDENDNLYGWGYYGSGQTVVPNDIAAVFESPDVTIKQMVATQQWTGLLGTDGNFYIWGSTQAKSVLLIPRDARGRIVKVAEGDNNVALLLDDGTVTVIGERGTEFASTFPTELSEGNINIVDLVATNRNVLAVADNGDTYLWGSTEDGLSTMPELSGEIVAMDAGYKNFVVLLDNGEVVQWGSTGLGQDEIPTNMGDVERVYADYFQFYAINSEDGISAWGNEGYVLGSDQYGRDMLTRLIHGGRISLTVGLISVVISTTIALFVGLLSGYFGGWVDHVLMRLTDVFSAIPFIPIAVTLSYAVGHSMSETMRIYLIMVILGLLGWMGLARLIRAQLLLEREKDFVLAARALGIKQGAIMWRHILPNVFNLVIVNITLNYARSLLSEAGLSFLGFGVTEPTPSWGNMLSSAQQIAVIEFYWWRWVLPGVCVIIAALCANLVGDALREAMDPRANEK